MFFSFAFEICGL